MKNLYLILLCFAASAWAETVTIALSPNVADTLNLDYGHQIIEKFDELRKSNSYIQKQFSAFELPSEEAAGGRYMGASATPFVLREQVDVDFRDDGGQRDYRQTVVLYYSFKEGYHKGMEATRGVFAIFHLVGHQEFDNEGGDSFKLTKHEVTATFQGLTTKVIAEQGAAANP